MSRTPHPSNLFKNEVLPHTVGYDEVVVVCNIEGVPSLTMRQIADVFAGEVANWKDFGGPDEVIHVFVRDENSGTRAVFDRAMKKVRRWTCASSAKACASADEMAERIRSTYGSIGYLGLAGARSLEGDGTCHTIVPERTEKERNKKKLKGCSDACIAPRTLSMLVDGKPSGNAGAFLTWAMSDDGQAVLSQDFKPLEEKDRSVPTGVEGDGEIVIGGSTSMSGTLEAMAGAFSAEHPGISVSVRDGGSMTADADTESGDLDVGAAAGGYKRKRDYVSVFGLTLTLAAAFCLILPLGMILYYWGEFSALVADIGKSMLYIFELMFLNVEVVSYSVMIVGGILIYFSNRLPYSTRVSLCGLILGISFLIRNIDFYDPQMYSGWNFVIAILSVIAGGAAIIASFATMFGYNHYSFRLVELAAVMVFIDFWPLYNVYRYDGVLYDYLMYVDRIPLMASYVIFMVVMMDKSIRVQSANRRTSDNIDTIGDMTHVAWDAYITPADLILIRAALEDRSDITVEIRGESHPKSLSIINVPGHDHMVGMVTPRRGGSFMDGFRFDVVHVHVSDSNGMLRIYGNDGVFVELVVKDLPPNKTVREMLSIGH
ncbi:MAG: substrate-binding domain-containing protein [Thermoplasmata archaeon]|nr:substrate-binding domain-containing protein [Thermoplasmata archaeon]